MDENVEMPNNHMIWAILSAIFCFLPLGIVSIYYAWKVDGLYNDGKYEEAQESADKAKNYAIFSAGVAVVLIAVQILIFVLAGTGFIGALMFG